MSLTLLISTKHHLWLGPNQSTWPNVVAHPLSDRFAVNRAYWSPIFDPDSPTVNNPVFRTVLETLSNPLIFSYSDSNNATHVDSLTAAHDSTFTWPNVVAHTIPDRTSRASTNAAANSSSYETAHTAAYGEANVSGYSTAHRTADSSAITTTDPNTYTASSSSTITTAHTSTYTASSSSPNINSINSSNILAVALTIGYPDTTPDPYAYVKAYTCSFSRSHPLANALTNTYAVIEPYTYTIIPADTTAPTH